MKMSLVNRSDNMKRCLLLLLALIAMAALWINPAFATGAGTTSQAIGAAKTVVNEIIKPAVLIFGVVAGGIFVAVGAMKYASAHAEGEGPAMHKAINMLSSGIAVIAISVLVGKTNIINNLIDIIN